MTITKWALLCGGDFYLPTVDKSGRGPTNLRGCVGDVRAIQQALLDIGVASNNIRMLTASSGPNDDRPVESEKYWPTRKNIRRELDHIKKNASHGDLLYFHFSGHGGMRDVIKDHDAHGDFDGIRSGTALFMTDVFQGGPYLTGRQLGRWLEVMVAEKALRVTVVFDSCHSGGAFRNDAELTDDVRTLVGPPVRDVDRAADDECDLTESGDTRDAIGIRSCWLSNPKNCTVLTACSSYELARERTFEGRRHGVMTYWLLQLLKASRRHLPSHSRAVEYIRRQIDTHPRQTPLAYGDVLHEFFGHLRYSQGEMCIATLVSSQDDSQEVRLDIGADHGVAVGARYNVFLADGIVEADQRSYLMVTVREAKASYSSATPVPENDTLALRSWRTGETRQAILDHWALARPVSIHAPFLAGDRRERLRTELENTLGLSLSDEQQQQQQDHDLTLRVNEKEIYEVFYRNELLRRLPSISASDGLWAAKLARVLSHVARYKELIHKYNTANLAGGLSQTHFGLTAVPDRLKHDGETLLRLWTKPGLSTDRDLWVSLYCFSNSWQIYKVFPDAGHTAERHFFDHWPDGLLLQMEFPPKVNDSDLDEVEDLLVVFVSTSRDGGGPPSWGDICLPHIELNESCKRIQWHALEEPEGDGRGVRVMSQRVQGARWTAMSRLVTVLSD